MPDFDFSTLITDRSPADLQALRALLATPMADWTAEQLAQFNQAVSKGAYNYTDLNRVIAAMDDINERLTALGYVTGYHPIIVHTETPPPTPTLPEGYTELEYIESSGTQYINTGFTPNQDTRVVCDVVFPGTTGTSGKYVFGSRTTLTQNSYTYFSYNSKYETTYNTQDNVCYQNLITGRFIVDKNKNITTTNGTEYSHTYANFTCPGPLYLFALNNNGSLFGGGSLSLYSCQIYDNEALVRDFIPCTDPSGAAGLYDRVGNQFYGNAGSGSFTAGPEVPQPEPTLDPYTWYEEDAPTATQMQRYLANVDALRGALVLPEDMVGLPADMTGLTQAEANAIEGVLGIINDYLEAMQRIFLRSGMAWAISGGPNYYFAN